MLLLTLYWQRSANYSQAAQTFCCQGGEKSTQRFGDCLREEGANVLLSSLEEDYLQSAPALKDVFPALPARLWSCQELHTHRGDGCRRQIREPEGMAVHVQEHIVAILSLLDEKQVWEQSEPTSALSLPSFPSILSSSSALSLEATQG